MVGTREKSHRRNTIRRSEKFGLAAVEDDAMRLAKRRETVKVEKEVGVLKENVGVIEIRKTVGCQRGRASRSAIKELLIENEKHFM